MATAPRAGQRWASVQPGDIGADPVAAQLDAAVIAVDGLMIVELPPLMGVVEEESNVAVQRRLIGLERQKVIAVSVG